MKKMVLILLLLSGVVNAQNLSNLFFLNDRIGWIQTVQDIYTPLKSYRTTNGGSTWIQMDSRYHYIMADNDESKSLGINFINDSVGYLVSADSILYKTIDKGETWELLANQIKFSKVVFINEKVGYSKCTTGIYKTSNGGANWNFIINTIENDYPLYLGAVVDEDRVLIYNKRTRENYYLTTDGGFTWNRKTVTEEYFGTHLIFNIIFINNLHGYLVLSRENPQDENHSGTYFSSNGGNSWHFRNEAGAPYFSMENSINGILFSGGYYKLTQDGFFTVKYKNNLLAHNYFYKSCKEFYACGDSGYFAKSIDCGDTWTEIPFVVLNPTNVNENNSTINNYSLEQNYPNPFNPSTSLNYNLLNNGMTTIKIYDILGKEITTLVNEYQTSGNHYVHFNAEELNSGVYFYKINSGAYTEIKKMLFLK